MADRLGSAGGWRVIDASGLIMGRLSSVVAKRLLKGERIAVINAEKAVLSGKRLMKVREFKGFLEVGGGRYGPFHPRRPDTILRRCVRGMLPREKPTGREAFKNLRVFIGSPPELSQISEETVPEANASKLRCRYVTLGKISQEIGRRSS